MDDDVVVDPKWLHNLTTVLQQREWAGVGGRILPERGFTPPAWLSLKDKYALAPLAVFDLGTQAGEMCESPFGTNMAFRREAFSTYGGFRTDLGPQPGSEIQHNEDSEFGSRFWPAANASGMSRRPLCIIRCRRSGFAKHTSFSWWIDKTRADTGRAKVPGQLKLANRGSAAPFAVQVVLVDPPLDLQFRTSRAIPLQTGRLEGCGNNTRVLSTLSPLIRDQGRCIEHASIPRTPHW